MMASQPACGTPGSLQAECPERLGCLRRLAAREREREAGHASRARIDQSQDHGKIRVAGDLATQGDGHRQNLQWAVQTELRFFHISDAHVKSVDGRQQLA